VTRHLVILVLVAVGCSHAATPEQACKNIETRCGELAGFAANDVADCAHDLPKLRFELGDADYNKFLGCVKDADSCGDALGCFGGAGKVLGGKLTHNVLDDMKQ
jgi:hypothetical protein